MSPNVNQSHPGTGTTGYVPKSTAIRMSPNVNQSQPGTSTTEYVRKSTATRMSPNVNHLLVKFWSSQICYNLKFPL